MSNTGGGDHDGLSLSAHSGGAKYVRRSREAEKSTSGARQRLRRPRTNVVALVPCYNCAATIEATVAALLTRDEIDRVIVIDDGSTDDTAAHAHLQDPHVVVLPQNLGKAAAIEIGVKLAPNAEIFLLVDADTRSTAVGAMPLVEAVRRGECDLAIGVLPSAGKRGGFGLIRVLGRLGILLGVGLDTRAPLSGQRAIRAEYLRRMSLSPRFGAETSMTIDLVRMGGTVAEYDVDMDHHHTGRSIRGFFHRARQGRDVCGALWTRIMPKSSRLLLVAVLLLLSLVALAQKAPENLATPAGVALPKVESVRIVAVPYWSYDNYHYGPEGDLRDTGLASLDRQVQDFASFGQGSVAMGPVGDGRGELEDVTRVLASGSRDPSAPVDPRVAVTTERVANTAQEVVDARRNMPPRATPTIYVGVNTVDSEVRLRPVIFSSIFDQGVTLSSSTTHRAHLMDITDLAPTVLALQGQEIPSTMTGKALTAEPHAEKAHVTTHADTAQLIVEMIRPYFVIAYLLVGAAVLGYWWLNRQQGIRRGAMGALIVAAAPLATYLTRMYEGLTTTTRTEWFLSFGVALLAIVLLSLVGSPTRTRSLRRIFFATMVFFLIDAWMGTPWQYVGVFGSNPALGARYFGFGNPATAVLLATTFSWMALHVDAARRHQHDAPSAKDALLMGWVRAGAALALVLAAIGLPGLGADVGGLAYGTLVGLGLLVALRFGRVRAHFVLWGSIVTAAIVSGVGWWDSTRPTEVRGHLGTLVLRMREQGWEPLWDVAMRKIEANILGYGFPWNLLVPLVGVVALVALLRGRATTLWPNGSPLRAGVIATVSAGLLGFLVNDSGVVIVALSMVGLLPLMVLAHGGHDQTQRFTKGNTDELSMATKEEA